MEHIWLYATEIIYPFHDAWVEHCVASKNLLGHDFPKYRQWYQTKVSKFDKFKEILV